MTPKQKYYLREFGDSWTMNPYREVECESIQFVNDVKVDWMMRHEDGILITIEHPFALSNVSGTANVYRAEGPKMI